MVSLPNIELDLLIEDSKDEKYLHPAWTGDLEDDCFLLWRGFVAHVEKLGECNWFGCIEHAGITVFHSLSDTSNFNNGEQARSFIEGFILSRCLKESGVTRFAI